MGPFSSICTAPINSEKEQRFVFSKSFIYNYPYMYRRSYTSTLESQIVGGVGIIGGVGHCNNY